MMMMMGYCYYWFALCDTFVYNDDGNFLFQNNTRTKTKPTTATNTKIMERIKLIII